jgi:hypothetical protein
VAAPGHAFAGMREEGAPLGRVERTRAITFSDERRPASVCGCAVARPSAPPRSAAGVPSPGVSPLTDQMVFGMVEVPCLPVSTPAPVGRGAPGFG